jgi:competence protein ComEA
MMLRKFALAAFVAIFLSFGSAFAADKININTATVEQLETLNGIGPATAKAIVEYREANGQFKSVYELTNVKGIGEKKIAKWSDSLVIEE